MKRLLITLFIIILIAGVVIFINRYKLVQYSAEKIILSMLPSYLKIEGIDFNLKDNEVNVSKARIANPVGFSSNPIVEIESLRCRYKPKSANLLEGINILELVASRPVLRIERRADGKINFEELKDLGVSIQKTGERPNPSKSRAEGLRPLIFKKPSELLKLPDAIDVRDGSVIFVDTALYDKPYVLTFDNISSRISLKLNDDYSRVLYLNSSGSGNVNRKPDESVEWVISFNPTTPKLTMSNRFKVSRVTVLPFQPYFLRFSPFIFRSGRFSGDLVFDFDNGNIGSTNTVWLEGLSFQIKEGYEGAPFWQTTVPNLVKYLTSSSGAVVFDFKIKGEMSKPDFHLGPISKQALAAMTIDKITETVSKTVKGEGAQSNLEKVQDVIDVFKGMLKKR